MKLGVVILAAGKAPACGPTCPRCCIPWPVGPCLRHVLAAAQELGAARICVVQGPGDGQVSAALAEIDCVWVAQAEQHGTGHALIQAMPMLRDMDRVLVLYGDVPLIRAETLRRLIATAASTPLGILTATLADPRLWPHRART